MDLSEEEIKNIPEPSEPLLVASASLVVTLTYSLVFAKKSKAKLTGPFIPAEAASLSAIAPGMPENKLINITSQDFAGEPNGKDIYTKSKSVVISGPPAGNYSIRISSSCYNTYLESMGILLWEFSRYPSIKIEGDGSLLVEVIYPIPKYGKVRTIQDSWMFTIA